MGCRRFCDFCHLLCVLVVGPSGIWHQLCQSTLVLLSLTISRQVVFHKTFTDKHSAFLPMVPAF